MVFMDRFQFAEEIERQLKMGAVDLRGNDSSRFLFTINTRDLAKFIGFDDPGYFMAVEARSVIGSVDGLVENADPLLSHIIYQSAEIVADGLFLLNRQNPICRNLIYVNNAVDLELASERHIGAESSAAFFQALTGSFLQKIR
jgi:hypothetical protein